MTATPSRLIVLPDNPGTASGYQKGVRADLERLHVTAADTVVVYTADPESRVPGSAFLSRKRHRRFRLLRNFLAFRTSTQPSVAELKAVIPNRSFDEIVADETIFYRPLRQLFPKHPMTVRFHNFFSMARYRQGLRQFPIRPLYRYHLESFFRAERKILQDPLVTPIFVTSEEQNYCALAYPGRHTLCWPNSLQIRPGEPAPAKPPAEKRLIYFGGIPAHTRPGVDRLVHTVMPALHKKMPDLELHLFGFGTERYRGPGIIGHGFHTGSGYPMDGLYTVPDLHGLGIKIKVGDYLHDGVPFIVTPFGTEGYAMKESEHVLIADIDVWADRIAEYFQQHSAVGATAPAMATA